MDFEHILVERQGRVGIITMNHPERLNAWSAVMEEEMRAAAADFDEDEGIGAIIFTGAGRGYCAGADISTFASGIQQRQGAEGAPAQNASPAAKPAPEPPRPPRRRLGDWTTFIMGLRTPTIAAVNGPAVGMGLSTMLSMDMRIASERATFGAFFVKMGVVPELGSSHLLPQLIGAGTAMEWILTARQVPAEEARQAGLVIEVTGHDELISRAVEIGALIASRPAPQVEFARRLVQRNTANPDLQSVMQYELELLDLAYQTWEHEEAVLAFFQKRDADFASRPSSRFD